MSEPQDDPRVIDVKAKVDAIFGDRSATPSETLELIEEIAEYCEGSIAALKDDIGKAERDR